MRRDKLNDRFLELASILDPGRPLRESNESLQKINELKAEKNEHRDEKQRLKTEKENLERQVKALGSQPRFLPHPPAIPTPFSTPGQVVGGKMVPLSWSFHVAVLASCCC